MNAVDRAAQLGTQHGTRRADVLAPVDIARACGANDGDLAFYGWDLTGPLADAYEAAYTTAVETTIREMPT